MNQSALQIDSHSLRRLQPLATLADNDLLRLGEYSELVHLQAGEHIEIRIDAFRSLDFLISGEIELVRGQNTRLRIRQDSRQARHALHETLPRYERICARSSCTLLRINQEQLERILQANWQDAYEIEEIQIESDMHSMANLNISELL